MSNQALFTLVRDEDIIGFRVLNESEVEVSVYDADGLVWERSFGPVAARQQWKIFRAQGFERST
jgi:hypothetical protein